MLFRSEELTGSYSVVPSSYVKVATLVPSSTPVSSSSLTATYRVNIASTQPAGFYNGKVRYVLVNPATNVPNEPKACSANKICYWPNAGNEVTDTMGDQSENYINVVTAITSNMDVNLWPSNFKRTGYGFAGWSDAYDYVANVGSASNPDAHIYGPMANIHLDDMSSGLSLYAVWVKSEGNLQGWNGCTSLSQGNVTALTDQRDGDTYAVAKLADNKCWMIENLRLDADYSNDSSLAQGFGGVFAGLAQSETTFTGSTTANSLYKSDGSGDIKGVNGAALSDIGTTNYPSNRFPRYNNSNTDPSTNETNMTSVDDNVYSYGNYYTWASAIADTNYYTSNQSVSTSICPSGWRLPRGGNKTNEANNDFWYLIVGSINSGVRPANYNSSSAPFYTGQTEGAMMSNKLTSYPNNFVYSGVNNAAKGSFTFYNSSTSSSATSRYSFGLMATDVYPGTDSWSKYELMLIRCMYGNLNQ